MIRTRRFQPLASLAFAWGMARLWWINRSTRPACLRRLKEI